MPGSVRLGFRVVDDLLGARARAGAVACGEIGKNSSSDISKGFQVRASWGPRRCIRARCEGELRKDERAFKFGELEETWDIHGVVAWAWCTGNLIAMTLLGRVSSIVGGREDGGLREGTYSDSLGRKTVPNFQMPHTVSDDRLSHLTAAWAVPTAAVVTCDFRIYPLLQFHLPGRTRSVRTESSE